VPGVHERLVFLASADPSMTLARGKVDEHGQADQIGDLRAARKAPSRTMTEAESRVTALAAIG
jgi:hypothetical protein